MNVVQKTLGVLGNISNDLHDLTLEAVFSKQLLDKGKLNAIDNIKANITQAADALDRINVIEYEQLQALESVVKECISSLHQVHVNMHQDLIDQNAEEDYALLSAQMSIIHSQIERIKNS